MNRQSFGMSQSMPSTNSARTNSATNGCSNASHSTTPTARSSPNEAAQFENGSGEVLIAMRPPDFVRWLPAASVPPRIAAASIVAPDASPNTLAASTAPAGMRTNVCTVSQNESNSGTLSATNSTTNMENDATST